jgi:hypothetical protein
MKIVVLVASSARFYMVAKSYLIHDKKDLEQAVHEFRTQFESEHFVITNMMAYTVPNAQVRVISKSWWRRIRDWWERRHAVRCDGGANG